LLCNNEEGTRLKSEFVKSGVPFLFDESGGTITSVQQYNYECD